MVLKAPGAPSLVFLPIAISIVNKGIPNASIAIVYTSKKAPPPYLAASPGKRHALPRPTAEPMAAKIKVVLEAHSSLTFKLSPHQNNKILVIIILIW